jgi:hypothetical protein
MHSGNEQVTSVKSHCKEFWTLLNIHLKEYRLAGNSGLVASFVFPIGVLIIFRFVGLAHSAVISGQLLVGTIIFSCINVMLLGFSQKIVFLKYYKGLEFYLALPVNKAVLFLSLIVASILFQLPITLSLYLFSKFLLIKKLVLSDLYFIFPSIVILGFFGMCGLILGIMNKNPKQGTIIGRIVVSFIVVFTPVYYSSEHLSSIHAVFTRLTPIPYMSDMLLYFVADRGTINTFMFNISIVAVYFLIAFAAIPVLEWRD